MASLVLLAGAAPAHAGASLRLAESDARAGDPVHFTITDVDDDETYAVLIDGRVLAAGAGTDDDVSGHFTMPELGRNEAKVTVTAEIVEVDDPRDRKTSKRKLRYLGPGLPAAVVTLPPAPAAPPASPAPVDVPAPLQATTSPPPAAPAAPTAPARRAPRQARKRQAGAHRRSRPRNQRRRGQEAAPKRKAAKERKQRKVRTKRNQARTAPLFDGVPEGSGGAGVPDEEDKRTPRAGARPTAAITNTTGAQAGDGASAAIVIPAMLGLGALGLAVTAALRSRRRSR